MDISSIFSNAFDYAKKMFTDIGRLIILIVLNIIPIVDFIVLGYAAKVVRDTPSSAELPPLKGYLEMWVQGLKIVVASIIWMIVPLILIGIGIGFAAVGGAFSPFPAVFTAGMIASAVVGVVIMFFVSIIMLMALIHMIRCNRFSKAFAVGEILDIIKRIGWGKYIIWVIVIFVISLIIGSIASIPYVGWIIFAIISPVYLVFVAKTGILLYSEKEPTPTTPPSEGKFCKNCGEKLTPEATYCPKCGQKIE